MKTSDILHEIDDMCGLLKLMLFPYQYITSLRQREANTVDPVEALVSPSIRVRFLSLKSVAVEAIRVYMLDYGDSKDGYFANEKKYETGEDRVFPEWQVLISRREKHSPAFRQAESVAQIRVDPPCEILPLRASAVELDREVAGAARECADRRSGRVVAFELRDDPSYSQDVLDSVSAVYDGVRRRALPKLYSALAPGTDDDRMKGALWTLNLMSFGKYAAGEVTLAPQLIEKLFACQHNEKPSIQDAVSTVAENCLNSLSEASDLVYKLENKTLDAILAERQLDKAELALARRCEQNRLERSRVSNEASKELVRTLLAIGNSSKTHWKYEIAAIRCLRAIIRRDVPTSAEQIGSSCTRHTTAIPIYDTVYLDKDPAPGWLAWGDSVTLCRVPDRVKSTFLPWERGSDAFLSVYFGEENHESTIVIDNVSYVKSIFQLLEDEPFEALQPVLYKLLDEKELDKQRALAEFTAGPVIVDAFSQKLKTDTVSIWQSLIEYLFQNKDPRRLQPLVDHIMELWTQLDFQPELAFDATKYLSIFKSFYRELNWKFLGWTDQAVERYWKQLEVNEHEDVRAFIADILLFSNRIKSSPRPSCPSTEVFVRECRTLPVSYDIMGMRGMYHMDRFTELVGKFHVWREERVSGVRAFQSTYDRVGITICKFLFQLLLNTSASAVFDYVLPLMASSGMLTAVSDADDPDTAARAVQVHRAAVNDNQDLATRANDVLVQMCGVTVPVPLINPLIDGIFESIRNSPSWKVRLKAIPLIQIFYFRQLPLISDGKLIEMLEVLCQCLDDEVINVREMAATTLSGILRLSPRRHILTLRDRFVQLIKKSHIPPRSDPAYAKSLRQRHAAILGVCALVDSVPYTVEKWTPDLLTNVLAEHTYDPVRSISSCDKWLLIEFMQAPISTTVRKCARNFSRTHRDTWHEDSARFDESQLAALSTLLTGSSYYA
ncbi:unnamed protein product [Mycena citricolor]|uniref:Proteasome activator complex subunit 4 C-terminal domain-containing protein n=1 Tax=Mycena citricolor TaxID=2018698 RepID=A0AAD2GWK8_9AGAR|nr:unnamed protein product [Mycena citricolor]